MKQSPARLRFRSLIRLPEEQLPLADAAFCIAWEDQGAGEPEAVLQQLDAIAGTARLRLEDLTNPYEVIAALNDYLFDELGFRGNATDYHNPTNSFLDRVLETRTGLPIVLSVIYMEIGWRLGLPISGVALPGHFITRYTTCKEEIFVDPFNRGRLWSWHECEQQISTAYGGATPTLLQQVMEPPTKRSILARMLRNLKQTYLANKDFPHALASVERLLLLDPSDMVEVRDRGLLRVQVGQVIRGLEDLERYVRATPHAPDLPELQQYAGVLTTGVAKRN